MQLSFRLPWGQGVHTLHLYFTLPWGQGVHSAQLPFRLPCGQGLHPLHLHFALPCEECFIGIVRAPRHRTRTLFCAPRNRRGRCRSFFVSWVKRNLCGQNVRVEANLRSTRRDSFLSTRSAVVSSRHHEVLAKRVSHTFCGSSACATLTTPLQPARPLPQHSPPSSRMAIDFELSGQGPSAAPMSLEDIQEAAVECGFTKPGVVSSKPNAQRANLNGFFKVLGVTCVSGFKKRFHGEKLPCPYPDMTPLIAEKVREEEQGIASRSTPYAVRTKNTKNISFFRRLTSSLPNTYQKTRTSPRRRKSRGPFPTSPSTTNWSSPGRTRNGACSPSPVVR